MSEKEDLKVVARKLGVSEEGTTADLKQRIANAQDPKRGILAAERKADPGPIETDEIPEADQEPDKKSEPEQDVKESSVKVTKATNAQSEHFYAGISSPSGRELLSVQPVGWVGPSPLIVGAERLDELIEVLQKLQ